MDVKKRKSYEWENNICKSKLCEGKILLPRQARRAWTKWKNKLKIDNRLIIRIDDVKLLFDFVLYTFFECLFCSYKNELCVDNIWFLLKSLIEPKMHIVYEFFVQMEQVLK